MTKSFIFYGSVFHNMIILTVVLLDVTKCTLVGSNSWEHHRFPSLQLVELFVALIEELPCFVDLRKEWHGSKFWQNIL
jgi:hypothetical protein